MKKGFTLLELLIVVVIIGVLALIAAPSLMSSQAKARIGAVKGNVNAAVSTATGELAVMDTPVPSTAAKAASDKLNANNKNANPYDSADATTFLTAASTKSGSVSLVGDDAKHTITVTGTYLDTDGTTVKTIQKVIESN